jgi:hypothetical protein
MIKIVDFEDSDENLDNDFDFSKNLLGKLISYCCYLYLI